MAILGSKSKGRLATCHPALIKLVEAVSEKVDIVVVCGHRGESDQNAAFAGGFSKVEWPNSKHNSIPSMAVDLAPTIGPDNATINWSDLEKFNNLGQLVKAVGFEIGVHIEWGGDWVKFKDRPHFQIRAIALKKEEVVT